MAAACARSPRRRASTLPDPAALVLFSRWITPPQVQIRFDTLFFLAAAPDGAEPRPDGGETVDVRWFEPPRARGARGGEIAARLPDDQDARAARAASAPPTSCWSGRDGREVEPIEPLVVIEGEVARVVLPGEPGYRD